MSSLVAASRVAELFVLKPSLADLLVNIDRFGAALVAPAVIEQAPPAGCVRAYPETHRPTAVDYRKALTEQVIEWHNHLVQARLQLDTTAAQIRSEMAGRAAAEKRTAEIERELVAARAQLEEKTQELSVALHTISELQERELDRLSLTQDPMTAVSPAVAS